LSLKYQGSSNKMTKTIVQDIFREKNKLEDIYPRSRNVLKFDLERKHFFYGRIDKEGDIVLADTNSLVGEPAAGDSSASLIDFVSDAFFALKVGYRKASAQALDRESVFYRDLKLYKSWTQGSLDTSYTEYMSTLYTTFVDKYLAINRRQDKIKNFKDFVAEFLNYSLRVCEYYPITLSGFISSVHCSPFVSGLMLEIAPEQHGVENNANIYKYLGDDYYDFWSKHVQKYGFMVDKNAPWRLVFNVASGFKQLQEDPNNLKGAQIYMNRYGVTYENVFQYRFIKAYKYDMSTLRAALHMLYTGFYQQFSTYEKEELKISKDGRCQRVKVVHKREDRTPPPPLWPAVKSPAEEEYWLKVLLRLRMTETKFEHDLLSFVSHADDLIEKYRMSGPEAALKHINSLTKGFYVTRFNMKGANWHGVSNSEYQRRRRQALKDAESGKLSQYSLTGTGNIVK